MVKLGAAIRRVLDRFLVRIVAGVVAAGIVVMGLIVAAVAAVTSASGLPVASAGQVRTAAILLGIAGVVVLGVVAALIAYRETRLSEVSSAPIRSSVDRNLGSVGPANFTSGITSNEASSSLLPGYMT